jgi:hypothetical protein
MTTTTEGKQSVVKLPTKIHSLAKLSAQAKGIKLESYIIEAVASYNQLQRDAVLDLFNAAQELPEAEAADDEAEEPAPAKPTERKFS